MKKCPKCGKIYDDSWGVCLNDSSELIDVLVDKTSEIPKKTYNIANDINRKVYLQAFLALLNPVEWVKDIIYFFTHSRQERREQQEKEKAEYDKLMNISDDVFENRIKRASDITEAQIEAQMILKVDEHKKKQRNIPEDSNDQTHHN